MITTGSVVLLALGSVWAFGWAIHSLTQVYRSRWYFLVCAFQTLGGAFMLSATLWAERIRELVQP